MNKIFKLLNLFNKINELKQAEDIFSDNQLTNLIKDRLKGIIDVHV